jgi:tripartite-type tricarboxylate transporter receptor subunit TctC
MTTKRSFWLFALCLSAFGAALSPAAAQADAAANFPNRPIRIIVNFSAGGSLDVLTRAVAQKLADKWGQPVVVENRTGAGGNIGAQMVARAAPDGYTLLATPPGPMTINEHLFKDIGFEPSKLVSVIMMNALRNVITARADFPGDSIKELIAYAKANPDRVSYASQGVGSTSHLAGQMFANITGTDLLHVPFRGEVEALNELLGGRVDLFMGSASSVLQFHRGKRVKVLAVASSPRHPMMPAVPTTAEAGLSDMVSTSWYAIAAPSGTPAAVANKLNAAIEEILKMPDVQDRFAARGAEIMGGSPAEMTNFIGAERARYKEVIDTAHIKLD